MLFEDSGRIHLYRDVWTIATIREHTPMAELERGTYSLIYGLQELCGDKTKNINDNNCHIFVEEAKAAQKRI